MELTEQDKPMLMLFIETSILNIQLKRLKMTLERLHHLYAHLVFCPFSFLLMSLPSSPKNVTLLKFILF